MIRALPLAATLALSTLLPAHAQSASAGKRIAEENCAPCHAIGKADRSKRRGAPALRTLSKRYDIDELQEAFAEGVAVGHKGVDMPEFQFTPDRVDALIAYIKTLQR